MRQASFIFKMESSKFNFFFLLLTHFYVADIAASYKVVSTAQDLQKSWNEALPGDTIYLQATAFKGQFVAMKSGTADSPITVIGGKDLTEKVTIVGQGTNKAAMTVTGNYWKFVNFTVSNRHSLGLLITGHDNNFHGIKITRVAKAVMIKGDRNLLKDCEVSDAEMGIYLEGDENVIVVNNLVTDADPSIFGRKGTCCGTLLENRYTGKLVVDGKKYQVSS